MPAALHRADVAHVVALVRFDLDHVGAELGEDLRRERPHDDGREVEDLDTGERAGHGCVACCSGLMPASRISLPQYSGCLRTYWEKSLGPRGSTSKPIVASRSTTSFLPRIASVSRATRSTMCFGVPAGTNRPFQDVTSKPFSVSAIGGTSGTRTERFAVVTPSTVSAGRHVRHGGGEVRHHHVQPRRERGRASPADSTCTTPATASIPASTLMVCAPTSDVLFAAA